MKIATNLPNHFKSSDGRVFTHLVDKDQSADLIVLLLPKNWGSGSVDEILEVADLVSSYPSGTPCFIVGCETPIPSLEFNRYADGRRDEAVSRLCAEVLARDGHIGVRGEITQRYLIDHIGCDSDRVDVIYVAGDGPSNHSRVRSFVDKIGLPADMTTALVQFQQNPKIAEYAKTRAFRKSIVIGEPYITIADGYARLNADIQIDGKTRTLWCETEETYGGYLLSERSDAFLCILVPYAMRTGRDIVCHAPVTDFFLHSISEVLIPHLANHDSRLHHTAIFAEPDGSDLPNAKAVSTGMSAGVDSMFSAYKYTRSSFSDMNLTHLYCGNYIYGNDSIIYDRARSIASEMGLPLVLTRTNINSEITLQHLHTHFYKTIFGVMALRKLFGTYYYSSTYDLGGSFALKDNSTSDTAATELMLLYCFSAPDIQFLTGGGPVPRLEKTRALIDFKPANRHLNVCLYPERKKNCGKCAKCLRTMITLDMLGGLDQFADVFPLEEYRANKAQAFTYMIKEKNGPFMAAPYEHFSKLEPEVVKRAWELSGKKP